VLRECRGAVVWCFGRPLSPLHKREGVLALLHLQALDQPALGVLSRLTINAGSCPSIVLGEEGKTGEGCEGFA